MNVGVIIGRFQIDRLHAGHLSLMTYVRERHQRVIVFLGCAPIIGTRKDPLDFATRARMVHEAFPEAVILPLPDMPSDQSWSENVDRQIGLVFPLVHDVTLYGGRLSFLPHYKGKHKALDVDEHVESKYSASVVRAEIGAGTPENEDQRRGVIWAIENSFGGAKQCVDIAMTKEATNQLGPSETLILVGKKHGETLWRLPGGMVDATDQSLEAAASRELMEETGLGTSGGTQDFKYIGSFLVDDWRFRKVAETKLMTALFHVPYFSGAPKGSDDLETATWVSLNTDVAQFHVNHRQLIVAVRKHVSK